MKKTYKKLRNKLAIIIGSSIMLLLISTAIAHAQYYKSELPPPAPSNTTPPPSNSNEVDMKYDVKPTVPDNYTDLMSEGGPMDLKTPSNITTTAEYDIATGCYVIRTRLGDTDIATPFMLSASQYNDWQMRQSMQEYYRSRNAELFEEKTKELFIKFKEKTT